MLAPVISVGHLGTAAFPSTYLTTFAARKPSHSSDTTKFLNKGTEEGTISEAMANDAPTVNGSQDHENDHVDKPAVIAKEPMVSKPMFYAPLSVKNHNGTPNHTDHNVTQRQPFHYQFY